MAERRPNRALGGPHDEFWAFCAQGELRLQRCDQCRRFAWPPVAGCEHCGGTGLSWERAAGTGQLVSWCVFHQPYHPELLRPYATIVVELAEGPWFISNPLDFGVEDMAAGRPLEVRFVDCEDDTGTFRLPVFTVVRP